MLTSLPLFLGSNGPFPYEQSVRKTYHLSQLTSYLCENISWLYICQPLLLLNFIFESLIVFYCQSYTSY